MRSKLRQTKKLRQASAVLAGEQFLDTDDQALIRAIRAGRVTVAQAYAALHHFGYRWDGRAWRLKYPGWMITFEQ